MCCFYLLILLLLLHCMNIEVIYQGICLHLPWALLPFEPVIRKPKPLVIWISFVSEVLTCSSHHLSLYLCNEWVTAQRALKCLYFLSGLLLLVCFSSPLTVQGFLYSAFLHQRLWLTCRLLILPNAHNACIISLVPVTLWGSVTSSLLIFHFMLFCDFEGSNITLPLQLSVVIGWHFALWIVKQTFASQVQEQYCDCWERRGRRRRECCMDDSLISIMSWLCTCLQFKLYFSIYCYDWVLVAAISDKRPEAKSLSNLLYIWGPNQQSSAVYFIRTPPLDDISQRLDRSDRRLF